MAVNYQVTGFLSASMPVADLSPFIAAMEQALMAAGIDVATVRFSVQAEASGASGASGPFPSTGASGATGPVVG
ncbi:MAG TPA: hypothetical protein VGR84_18625 [Candidatus Acidoferrales bacterium]|nr:hypothetical protein [Candidatus Acidoferrales bacterium]